MQELKRLAFLLSTILVCLSMAAVPALKVKRTVKQSDGKSLQIVLCGDESFHFYQTIDGVPVVENEDGSFDYATMDHGNLISTKMLAHETDERSISEKTFINLSKKSIIADIQTTWNKRLSARNAHRLKRLEARRAKTTGPNRIRKAGATQGEVKGLVILVNFADKKMTRTREEFDDQFNKIGYRKNSHIGSVREYFTSQSYGKLNIDFDVVGPYTVSKNMAYYGKDVGQAGDDEHPTQMVYEAIKLADKDVNFADYDWDGDGEVDQVYVIYAGYGQAQGAASNTIWPHEYVLEGGGYYNVRLDNVRLSTYACSCEFSGTSGTRMDGIGTACHEFTHCLGLPDFYDTSNVTANFGMSFWSVMDSGCYNGSYSGSVPAPYTSYERWVSGWLEPTELNVGCEVEGLRNIVNYPDAYVIYNEANHDEFYLLENHQKNSWDAYSYGKGMLILHVDYDETAWWENTVNNVTSRQRCTIIPADNKQGFYTEADLAGDPWPGYKKNKNLTNTSTPAAKLYNRNSDGTYFMNKPITDITENTKDSTISFTFNGGIPIPAPIANDNISDISFTKGTFTATWSAVEGADSYTIELRDVNNQVEKIFSQNFVAFGGSITNSGYDFAEKGVLDDYLTAGKGWTGSKVYTGEDYVTQTYMLKLGSSTTVGSLTTPTITAPSSGEITVYLQAHPYNRLSSLDFKVVITDVNGNVIKEENHISNEEVFNVAMKAEVEKDFKVTISTSSTAKRAFFRFLHVYNAALSESEIAELEDANSVKSMAPNLAETKSGKTIIEGITDTHYTFEGLTSSRYTYRVKAIAKERESAWSNRVTASDPTGIESITLDQLDPSTVVNVFSTSGQLIRKTTIANWSQALPRGTYILRTKNRAFKTAK